MEGHARAPETQVETVSSAGHRTSPQGLSTGRSRSRVQPPLHAWALVSAEMKACEQELGDLLGSRLDEVTGIARYLADSGGKRIRPLLTALGTRAVGGDGELARLMCVGEMIHLASLLHDDVVDEAALRRGRPAAHTVHGNSLVILTGDFCLARAVMLASEEGGRDCVHALSEAVTAMAEGEVLQLRNRGDLGVPLEEYLEVIDRKSAALIAWCAAAGALALGKKDEAEALDAFGRSVGVAFQITDDVLDYGGQAGVLGKQPGKDLLERKLTLPLLYAMEARPELRARLEERPPTPEELPELLELVRSTGALERSLDYARGLVNQGVQRLELLPDTPHRAALQALATYLAERAS